ncbi:MAG TPA: DNA primase, partial [Rhodospirillales bacterium]|nr:DNA primase [Rhodospirillales bacterium]
MAFSAQFLDELRSRIGLADVVGKRVKLTRKGHEHLGLCPFHKEKTPSFTLNEEKGFYHCFGCGAHGGAIDFAMQTDGLTFPEAVERLAAEAGMEVPADTPEERQRSKERQGLYEVVEAAAVFFEKSLRMPEGKKGIDYFRARGLDDETISRFRLGFAPDARDRIKTELARQGISEGLMVAAGLLKRPDDGRSPFGYFRNRVIFPICDKRGRPIAFGGRILGPGEPKYLNSPETPLFKKGRILYGLNLAAASARKEGTLVVAEGYMDVIALARAGIGNAVAPLGTA